MASKLKKSKNTVTKSISYPGKSYFDNAAKQFCWPIDHNDKQILVPENELQLAENDLMVAHFRSFGWHIQSCIEVTHTKPFIAPENKGPMFKDFRKPEEVKVPNFIIGQRFMIRSTECRLQINHIEKGKVHLQYTNRNKAPLLSSEENLLAVLRKDLWVRL